MADYGGEYGHPYPRVDEYGNPVPPVDQYGNPIPREPSQVPAYSPGGSAPSHASGDVAGTGTGVTPGYSLSGAVHPHESVVGTGTGVTSGYSLSGAAHPHESVVGGAVSPGGEGALSGSLAPGETTTAYVSEGMVGSGIISTGDRIQPAKEEHITLGETLRRTASSSSSSSSEDDGQGGRQRRKKSIKDKIKEKLPGNHKNDEHAVPPVAGTGTHEKKGIIEKIKEKLPGHH